MSSDEDGAALMAAFKQSGSRKAARLPSRQRPSKSPDVGMPERSSTGDGDGSQAEESRGPRRAIHVRIKPVRDRHAFTYYEPQEEVEDILREFKRRGDMYYAVKLIGGATKEINFEELLVLPGGAEALQRYQPDDDQATPSADEDMHLRHRNPKAKKQGFVDISAIDISSSEEEEEEEGPTGRGLRNGRVRSRGRPRRGTERSSRARSGVSDLIDLSTSDESQPSAPKGRGRKRKQQLEPTRRSSRQQVAVTTYDDTEDEEEDGSSDSDILRSDVLFGGKRKRQSSRPSKPEKIHRSGVRQSDRSTRTTNNMQEAGIEDVYRSDSQPRTLAPKLTQVREIFPTLPRSDLFRARHAEGCEVCYSGPNVAPLIYCQGCSLAYHKNCIGNRSSREHLVTKVGNEMFVLQCKRCINVYKKKDGTAPDLARCQDCTQQGTSCKPYRHRKSTQQEMKDREDNGGQDPIIDVDSSRINNAHNVLFRCTKCSRAWHYHHLPPLSQYAMDINRDDEERADERFREYSDKWMCKECQDTDSQKVSSLIAWRPSDVETYRPGAACAVISEDEKQYLVKWENQSYFRAEWFSGAWTWGVTAPAMRKAFYKREDGPKMRTEDAIPEEYLRIDIVLDIKFTSYVDVRSEEIDKARIKEVDKALIKYKGLGYEDAVWEKVPTPEDGDRWLDFVTAYNDWVAGRYVRYPKQGPLKARLEKARNSPFAKLEKDKQPDNLVGGELMKYQLDGLNWLYYQWYKQSNGILADEMGLGKTIQVIAFMATLVQEHNCFPFLIVVPNSTAANWRREIKQWIPSLRVVAYFGSTQARDMAKKYELYPENAKELRCHIVVTSYEAASDDSCRRMFRSVNWGGLIVDEGQRLKNDKSQLYTALNAVKAPFRLLMTGTPLQNNIRELFNLLQFVDDTVDAADLEEKYAETTSENIRELHAQIRPYVLRRTKAQVLTFLPPLGQVILPISMSHLQKQLYKSILSKRPELLKALFISDKSLKQQERANLSNILMQLRKCLCHPFVYSREIEERTDIAAVSHRNLVEASAKLSLLEVLLPKLKERGHRVLIFSQFLDMLSIIEDFLDGMQMAYQRLDGQMGSLEKQKRIDQFNAPDSPLFAFLLSTRAGGVGINLATADTVIILDPDWNPHQDLQAIARAHRIGQEKKVLCFQLMTRSTVEEKIIQMGRKKMALDHVVVEHLDTEDIEEHDVESILKFGAAELFKDDNTDQDIRYDDEAIEKLLDRSQIENKKASATDDSADAQFSFARVWASDKGALQDDLGTAQEEVAPDPGVWDKILKERQAVAAAEALARAEAMGRGRRARGNVDYATEKIYTDGDAASVVAEDALEDGLALALPLKKGPSRKKRADSESDTDFQAESEDESEPDQDFDVSESIRPEELDGGRVRSTTANTHIPLPKQNGAASKSSAFPAATITVQGPPRKTPIPLPGDNRQRPQTAGTGSSSRSAPPGVVVKSSSKPSTQGVPAVKAFRRAHLPIRSPLEPTYGSVGNRICPACHKRHPQGACELKAAGVEHCGLCGLAHFGHSRTCPHIKSETQVRAMLEALKNSNESKELVDAAMKYLRGVKGTLVQQKKRDREKAAATAQNGGVPPAIAPLKPRAPLNNTVKHVPYAPPTGASSSQYYAGDQTRHPNAHPQREVPWYAPIRKPKPPEPQQGAVQAQGEDQYQEQHVANALRGFLGQ
ncbi:PHD/FYVE-zinc-finger like domain-containing protein [Ampelomyces quisqualis]|uniref:PHD/FYVE-zinc-finger like domain-containing protein n=1 Tax=Ampelomyces quisqualis TaxID=50730 RepID=A0A6A5QCX1_AMPQU|nr:PHD/FYVE-zinc-finger like domain-containing protein [Ampelomyces quisqualis]